VPNAQIGTKISNMKKHLAACFLFMSTYVAGQQTIKSPTGIEFVLVNPGSYTYGKFQPPYPKPAQADNNYTPADFRCAEKLAKRDALPGFIVTVNRPFYIGKFEVTQGEWNRLMKSNPSFFKGDELPVESVTWDEVQIFIEALNKTDSLYSYRLPTEFEWEYVARAGKNDDISWDEIREQAQIGNRSTSKPGNKKPNAWGIYDMLGNVWEWTADVYNRKLFADKNPSRKGSQHVLKGASFTGDVKNATYMTHAAGPGNGWDVGFRLLMEKKQEAKQLPSQEIVPENDKPNGWHISRTSHQGTTPLVQINKNTITLKQHPYGQGGVLLTNKKYRDFDFLLEVKIDSFCNSGIFLRSTESGQAYQVELSEPGGTGSLFGEMLPVSVTAEAKDRAKVWKANDWNLFRIRMTGIIPRIQLWINGMLMWDITQPKNDFIGEVTEGMIGLQTHWSATYSDAAKAFDMSGSWKPNHSVKFRNIRIREL
jgi:formylglycine-generating enzyme